MLCLLPCRPNPGGRAAVRGAWAAASLRGTSSCPRTALKLAPWSLPGCWCCPRRGDVGRPPHHAQHLLQMGRRRGRQARKGREELLITRKPAVARSFVLVCFCRCTPDRDSQDAIASWTSATDQMNMSATSLQFSQTKNQVQVSEKWGGSNGSSTANGMGQAPRSMSLMSNVGISRWRNSAQSRPQSHDEPMALHSHQGLVPCNICTVRVVAFRVDYDRDRSPANTALCLSLVGPHSVQST